MEQHIKELQDLKKGKPSFLNEPEDLSKSGNPKIDKKKIEN